MKTNSTLILLLNVCILLMFTFTSNAQLCTLNASATSSASACKSTGSISVTVVDGSGNYNYAIQGPGVNSVTSSNVIGGLQAGSYIITVTDVVTTCSIILPNIVVGGNYQDPRFTLEGTNVSCIGASNGSITVGNINFGKSPYSFTIISPSAMGVGTNSTTGVFNNLIAGLYTIQMEDSCGGIQTRIVTLGTRTWNITAIPVSQVSCNNYNVTLVVTDQNGNVDTSGNSFSGFQYGYINTSNDTVWSSNYNFNFDLGTQRLVTLVVKDPCGNVKAANWMNSNVPTVSSNVIISNQTCNSFTATVTGQKNLTTPQYCLYNNGNEITCNSTGVFSNIAYGTYSIKVTDNCYDTTINLNFNASQPIPKLNSVNNSVSTCNTMDISMSTANLVNPYFCLYDSVGNLVSCDSTGLFNLLPYGSYCIKIKNDPACYDTTIVYCFNFKQPLPGVGSVNLTYSCTTFTATVTGQQNLSTPQYCLFNADTLVTCNSTGVFPGLNYDSYYIQVTNPSSCYDTTFILKFTGIKPIPSITAPVSITYGCNTFSAQVKGLNNFTNPVFSLLDATNSVVATNSTGIFSNINLGSYCVQVANNSSCYDTTITVCFTASLPQLSATVTTNQNCVLGTSGFYVTVSNGVAPYTINIYDPNNVLVNTTVSNNSYTAIYNVPTPTVANYTVVVNGACGTAPDTVIAGSNPSILYKTITTTNNCPGDTSLYGLGQITFAGWVNWGNGSIWPQIISQNGNPVNISFTSSGSSINGTAYVFSNLTPATYVVQTWTAGCSSPELDTVVINPYQYPSMSQSAIYQCNDNSFIVNAAANGGIAPYSYSIIGSVPSLPSIIQGPQASPTFNIGSGTAYSVVRLRAMDACGNATLDDAPVLPLGNTIVTASSNCFNSTVVLTVDSIPNATYSWYRIMSNNDTVLISNQQTYTISNLQYSDTGMYKSVATLNSGCLTRITYYDVTGQCLELLPLNNIAFNGSLQNNNSVLQWVTAQGFMANTFVVQKSTDGSNFTDIGTLSASANSNISSSQYYFTDTKTDNGNNYYRLRVTHLNSADNYSTVVLIKKGGSSTLSVLPNPVTDAFSISFQQSTTSNYAVTLISPDGKVLLNNLYTVAPGGSETIQRTNGMASGVYFLVVNNLSTNQKEIIKLLFK